MISIKRIITEIENDSSFENDVQNFEKTIISKYADQIKRFMVYYDKSTNSIELTDLYIKPEFYGQGYGSKIMSELVSFADQEQLPIILIPESDDRSNKKLIDFYKKFGFVVNKGSLKNYQLSMPHALSMYRLPK